jgi:hypothetical protein
VAWRPDYISATDVAAYLRVDDTVDNAEFGIWATAASRAIDKKTNRQFGQLAAPAARTYRRTPFYDRTSGMWVLEIDDVQDSTGLLVNGTAYASSGAVLLPDNAPADGRAVGPRIGFGRGRSRPTPGSRRPTSSPPGSAGRRSRRRSSARPSSSARAGTRAATPRSASPGRPTRARRCACWPGSTRTSPPRCWVCRGAEGG